MTIKHIGLLNIQRCDSHGAVLLAYAMEHFLLEEGYAVNTIDYKYAGRIVENNVLKKLINKLLIKWKKQLHMSYANKTVCGESVKSEYDIQHSHFEEFRKNLLTLTKEVTNVNDQMVNSFDAIVVGSDVVWKPEIARCIDRELYFLRSPKKEIRKVAYAASIGTNDAEFLEKYEECYENAFDRLDFISVREKSSVSFIKKFTDKQVDVVIDPVFLLDKSEYMKIEKKTDYKVKGSYVYVYILGTNEKAIKLANDFAAKNGLSIVLDINESFELSNLITVPCQSAISAGPQEFLYNLRNASYVMTDSFHATAFSIIYNKPFWVFKRGKISVRMSDLINTFSLGGRMASDTLDDSNIDWVCVNQEILKIRKAGAKWLLNALDNHKERETYE